MSIPNLDSLHPNEVDSLVSDPSGFGNLTFTEEDSPVSIDSMLSVQNGMLMFVSSVKIGTLVGLLETEDPRLSLEQRRQRKPDFRRIPGMAEYLHRAWELIRVRTRPPGDDKVEGRSFLFFNDEN